MDANPDGMYAAYFTGVTGNSMGMFIFQHGLITGADVGGGRYDGTYIVSENGSKIIGNVKFVLPVGNFSITGFAAETDPIVVDVNIDIPIDLNRHDVHRIDTPLGPINAKFDKIRSL